MSNRREWTDKFVNTCIEIRIVRKEYSTLFEHSDQRSKLLSEVAQDFFPQMRAILNEYILLQYCKLMDPEYDKINKEKRYNLTTKFMLSLDWSTETKGVMNAENAKMQVFYETIKVARNKIIGHFDLQTILDSTPLGAFEESEEWYFWKSLDAFVNAAHMEEYGRPREIINMPGCHGDAGDLIAALEHAMDYKDILNDPEENGFDIRRALKRRYRGD